MGVEDVASYIENDIQNLDRFMPPTGRLLLCFYNDNLAGMAALKELEPGIGEIKRMYVRREFRRQGFGRALINRLLEEASQIGYQTLRLDSAPFFLEAQRLYRSTGFLEIQPYEGVEVPHEFHKNWAFMELDLRGKSGRGSIRGG